MHVRSLGAALLGPLVALLISELALRTRAWTALVREHAPPGSAHHADALLHDTDAELVVVGSSVALLDVRPGLLASELGVPVVNTGILGTPVAVTAMRTEALLDTDARQFLLVVAAADLATDIPAHRVRTWEPQTALELFGLRGLLEDRDATLDRTLGSVSTAWRQRYLPRTMLATPSVGHPRDRRTTEDRDAKLVLARQRHRELAWSAESPNARGLQLLARRLASADRELVVVPAPQDPRVAGKAVRHELIALLTELQADAPFELVIPAEWPVWTPAHFRDPIHLAPRGQRPFTRGIAAALKKRR